MAEEKQRSSSSIRDALQKPEAAGAAAASSGGGKAEEAKAAREEEEAAGREIQVVPEATYRTEAAPPAAAVPVPAAEPPTAVELVGWYVYGFCSYFVLSVLLPVLFPAIIAQVASPDSPIGTLVGPDGANCSAKESSIYQRVVAHDIGISGSEVSPLGWTALFWAAGIAVATPILSQVAHHLDRGQYQSLILIGSISFGSFFCLLTGFFRTPWIFPFYVLFIAVAAVVAEAAQTRNLALMVRGLSANDSGKHLILRRRRDASQLSLFATAAGGVGATLLSAFTYHMLRRTDQLTALWVVSIFSGLIWFIGICHGLFTNRPSPVDASFGESFASKLTYSLTIFRYPHAIGSLLSVFLSSFITMSIFVSTVLYIIGGFCIRPVFVLALWLLYFFFPVISLPLLHPFQILINADAVRMQLLGFMLSAFVAGAGFYFKGKSWSNVSVTLIALVQGTAAGLLYAFGRVLLLDCAPPGKEGVFSSWYALVRSMGLCIGFGVGMSSPGFVTAPFAAAFIGCLLGIIVLVFGNVSNVGGLVAAGHVKGMETVKDLVVVEKTVESGIK